MITTEKLEGVTEIRLNKPDGLNAFDLPMAQNFAEAVSDAVEAESTRVILLSGAGKSFSAGGDLAFVHAAEDKQALAGRLLPPLHGALKALSDSSALVLAAVQGPIAGAGMSLTLAADLALAADDASFTFAYSKIGAPSDCGVSWSLPRLVGLRRAMEIALLSRPISAQEALSMGLVNRLVPKEALRNEARKLATRLSRGSPIASAEIKRLLNTSFERSFSEQLDEEEEAFTRCAGTREFHEAVAVFAGAMKRND